MPRTSTHDSSVVKRAQLAADAATDLRELRCAQSVLLPALMGATLEQTAAILGVGRATVCRLQKSFPPPRASRAAAPARKWGGRRNCWMTLDEEKEFLSPWLEAAAKGNLLVVAPIRAALAQRLRQPVKASVIYRLLARHGWRKVAPDTRHPKSSPAAQQEWKKNSPRHWRPC